MTLVALYSTGSISVAYDPGAGSGTVTDTTNYLDGSTAVVKHDTGLTPPSGQHFVYWTDKDENRYTGGNLLAVKAGDAVNGVITLTAQYAPDETPTSLIYDLNYSHYGKPSPCGL